MFKKYNHTDGWWWWWSLDGGAHHDAVDPGKHVQAEHAAGVLVLRHSRGDTAKQTHLEEPHDRSCPGCWPSTLNNSYQSGPPTVLEALSRGRSQATRRHSVAGAAKVNTAPTEWQENNSFRNRPSQAVFQAYVVL